MREIVLDTETTGLDPLGRSECLTNGNESGGGAHATERPTVASAMFVTVQTIIQNAERLLQDARLLAENARNIV